MPALTLISFATCNLYNLHLPGRPMYRNTSGWTQSEYDAKIEWIWAFEGMQIFNDHLNSDEHKKDGTSDHGIVKATFKYRPSRG